MTPGFFIAAAVVVIALHVWWSRRLSRERALWRVDRERLETHNQSAITEARARQDALLDSMIEAVLVLDASGRVQFANQAFAKMFETTGVLRGKTLLEAVRLNEVVEIVMQAEQQGRVEDRELRLPGTRDRWLQINAASLTSVERRKLGVIVVFHDLTRLKQLERTREEFVANVSHELRTPLSLIKGYTETLLDGAKDNTEVLGKFLHTIDRNARRLDLLIQDLLIISSLESGRVSLSFGAVNLRSLGERMLGDMQSRAGARHVTLRNELPELVAHADEARLEQVIGNLLENAVKYGRESGEVILGGRALADNRLEVFVQDDGPGIPADSLERVFERFYRVDKARSREQGGTGLGLAIVKHIVQAHGGQVWVESETGKGAKFFFTLRAAGPENEA